MFGILPQTARNRAFDGNYSRRGRTPIPAEPATVAFTTGHTMLTFRKGT